MDCWTELRVQSSCLGVNPKLLPDRQASWGQPVWSSLPFAVVEVVQAQQRCGLCRQL